MHTPLKSASKFALGLTVVLTLSGCLSTRSYVDTALPRVGKAEVGTVATPGPVQVLAEFRTQGNANARATGFMKPRVVAVVNESGLFASATEAAAANGATLSVVIDNVPLTDNAAAKGFGTGLTFGAVGTMVTDGYTATLTYRRGDENKSVEVKHAIHTTVGNHKGPDDLTPVTPDEAAGQVIDQITWNGLKQLREQGAFE